MLLQVVPWMAGNVRQGAMNNLQRAQGPLAQPGHLETMLKPRAQLEEPGLQFTWMVRV